MGWQDLEITFAKSELRGVVETNSEPLLSDYASAYLSDRQIYLFGSSSQTSMAVFSWVWSKGIHRNSINRIVLLCSSN